MMNRIDTSENSNMNLQSLSVLRIERMALVLLAGLALGSSAVMTRFGIQEIPPLLLVGLRLGLATLVFALTLVMLPRKLPRQARTWVDIAIVGIGNTGIPLVAFTLALQFISSGVLTIFLAMIPLFTSLMAHLWLGQEKLRLNRLAGLIIAFLGVVLLLVTGTTGLKESGPGVDLRGHLLGLVGVVLTAASLVYARRRLREVDVMVVTAGQMGTAFLIVAPFAFGLGTLDFAAISWRGWLAVAYTGIVGTFIGFLLLFQMVHRFGATVASLPGYVVPVVSILLGAFLLGEILTIPLGIGAILILAGVFFASMTG